MNRRQLLKTMGIGGPGLLLGNASAKPNDKVKGKALKIAGYDYDRARAILDGKVGIDGTVCILMCVALFE